MGSHAAIKEVSSMGAVPGRSGWRGQISFPEGWAENRSLSLEYIPVDFDFDKVLGFNMVAGRGFDASYALEAENAAQASRISALEADVSTLQGATSALQGQVGALEALLIARGGRRRH